jgi:hypothetical protein
MQTIINIAERKAIATRYEKTTSSESVTQSIE